MANTHSLDLESGSSQYASAGNVLDFERTNTFTVEGWVKLETEPTASTFELVAKAASSGTGYNVRIKGSGGRARLVGAMQGSNGTYNEVHGSSYLPVGVWIHVAVTNSGGGNAAAWKLYVNGVLESMTTDNDTLSANITNSDNFIVGSYRGTTNYFDGLIDDLRVWNTERTAAQIYQNRFEELVGNESGLVSYWKLNNAYTNSVGGGATLTATGSPVFSSDVHGFVLYPSLDSAISRDGVNQTFANIRSGAGTVTEDTAAQTAPAQLAATTTSNQYGTLSRGGFVFDMTAIPSTAVISALTLELYVVSKQDNFAMAVGIVDFTPASLTSFATSDYGNFGTTRYATDKTITSISTTAYASYALNATAIAAAQAAIATKWALGFRLDKDIDNSAPTWSSGLNGRIVAKFADEPDVGLRPKLIVTYTIPVNVTNSIAAPLTATFSVPSRTVTGGATVSPAVLSATFSIPSVTVVTPDALAQPSVLAATFSLPASTVTAVRSVTETPAVLSATFSLPAPDVVITTSTTPSALACAFSIPTPAITAERFVTVSSSVLAATFSIPASTTTGIRNAEVTPSALALTFSTPSSTVAAQRSVTVSPLVLALALSVPASSISADFWQPKYDRTTGQSGFWGNKY